MGWLLKNDVDVNVQGGHYGSALQTVSAGSHEAIIQLLLDKDVDIVQGSWAARDDRSSAVHGKS